MAAVLSDNDHLGVGHGAIVVNRILETLEWMPFHSRMVLAA